MTHAHSREPLTGYSRALYGRGMTTTQGIDNPLAGVTQWRPPAGVTLWPFGNPADLLTVSECATRAGVASSTWRAYVSRGQAPRPVTRVGREPLWDVEMVEAWLVGRRKA